MNIENIYMIRKEVKSLILNETVSHNELYLTVKKDVAVKLCDYIYHHFDAPLISMFATDERKIEGSFKVHYVFSFDREDAFIIIKIDVDEKSPYFKSITHRIPAASWYEREIQDMFGLVPQGHPDPRRLINFEDWPDGVYPLRKDFDISTKPPRVKGEYAYRRVEGEGVYEIPVGPVHAGVIEPGHFRFSVAGEPIINLEIRHFYTHKGVEKLFERLSLDKAVFLAERISGDNSVAHAVAFCQALEKIAGVDVPLRARYTRVILCELERLYNHLGDIAGIATDVAYGFGAAHANKLKEEILQLNERVTGSRMLRGMNAAGGVRRDIGDKKVEILLTLARFQRGFRELIEQALWSLPEGDIRAEIRKIPDGYALGYSEAPRGEVIYWVNIKENRIERCKVRDPSFCNWLAIEYAVLDNIVPDFPIIKKNLSLSYSGNDM